MRWGKAGARLFAALLIFGAVLNVARAVYDGTGPALHPVDVVVPKGGSAIITQSLNDAGLLASPLAFRVAVFLTKADGPLHAGEFLLPAGASLHKILDILRHGSPVQHQVTIPDGQTGVEIARLLNAAPVATGSVAPPADGAVLPQTYDYLWGTPRGKILSRAEDAMQTVLANSWAAREHRLPVTSARDALILASIVQAETPLPTELPEVAAVYENRLRLGMKLQADPTVIYAVTGGALTGGHGLSRTDLASASPYNTYVKTGLPPGPICAPGAAALSAVLHPAPIPALYFVATGDGGHVFTTSFAQHLKNIAAYHAAKKKGDRKPAP